jgi:hypothetical protein
MIRSTMLCLIRWGFLSVACTLLAASAWADSVPGPGEKRRSGFVAPPRTPMVRLTSWRSHSVCPMQGTVRSVRSVDSLREWRDTLSTDEAGAVGRRVLWSREKVLVYAMATQPDLGIQLEPAGSVLRLSSGVLWWPVKRSPPPPDRVPVTVQSRPCLIALVNRAQWHRIRVIERNR